MKKILIFILLVFATITQAQFQQDLTRVINGQTQYWNGSAWVNSVSRVHVDSVANTRSIFNSDLKSIIDPKQSIVISDFDSTGSTFIKYGANGTVVYNTAYSQKSNKSLKFISPDSTLIASAIKTASFNLVGYNNIYFRFYIDDPTKLVKIMITFANTAYDKYFYRNISNYIAKGWNIICFGQWQCTNFNNMAWADVGKIRIDVQAKTGASVTVYADELTAHKPQLDKGVVIIHFDDGNNDNYTTARKVLDKYNFSACAGIVGDLIGTSGRLTLSQMRDLQNNNGWDIIDHTWSHPVFDNITTSAIQIDIQKNIQFLKYNGIKNLGILSYPNFYPTGDSAGTKNELVGRYYSLASGSNFAYGSTYYTEPFPFASPLRLRGYLVQNADAVSTLLGYVTEAQNNRSVLILMWHHISDSYFSETKFAQLVDSLHTRDVEVTTYSNLMKKYYNKFDLDYRYNQNTFASDTSSTDTYKIVLKNVTNLTIGTEYSFVASHANTDDCSLQINLLTAVALKKHHDQDTATGDIEAGQLVKCMFDGTYLQITSQLAQ